MEREAGLPYIDRSPRLLVLYPRVLVLAVVTRLDRFLPLGLVVRERLALPWQVVRLPLISALPVDGHVWLFAATCRYESEHRERNCNEPARPHFFAPGCAVGCCASGLP